MRNAIFFSVSLLAGCSVSPDAPTARGDAVPSADLREESTARSVWDGTPEGIGALAFLNDAATTCWILDDKVPLDRRAAGNLIAHRDGGDALYGTKDDDTFDSIDEVDAVRWVGPKSIDRIIEYADDAGWVPTDDEVLGTWDQVSFTVHEAQLTIELVNSASEAELDNEVPLDRRAVNSILDARPLDTVAELAGLYYVGTSALKLLKSYAEDTLGEEEVEEPEDEVYEAYEDQFNHDEELDIPDDDSTGIEARVHVVGVPDIDVEIRVVGDFLHDAPEDLEIELVAPNGEGWNLTHGLAFISEVIEYSDHPDGYWTLYVTDTVAGNEGSLYGWALEIRSVDTF